jgi:hypothetical protein
MKSFSVNFNSRCRLTQILNDVSGPIGRTRPLLPILDKLIFPDDEWKKVKIVQNGDQIIAEPPDKYFGVCEIQIEDSQAEALTKELENSNDIKVSDLRLWANEILLQLKK